MNIFKILFYLHALEHQLEIIYKLNFFGITFLGNQNKIFSLETTHTHAQIVKSINLHLLP